MNNHFLYFIPNERRPLLVSDQLPAGHALKGCSLQCAPQMDGPGGSHGLILHRATPDGFPLHYAPQEQTWIEWKREGATPYWVGFWNDRKPDPESLRRPKILSGHEVELNDGNLWEIPVCGPINTRLPMAFDFRDNTLSVVKEWRSLFEESEFWYRFHTGEGEFTETSWRDALTFACKLVGANHYVSAPEATVLELLTTAAWGEIIVVAVGMYDVRKQMEASEGKAVGAT